MGILRLAEGRGHKFLGPKNATDVWSVKKINPNKMVHLDREARRTGGAGTAVFVAPGESVLDLFGGSGSTLIAAEQNGRRAYLMELDALYCDVIVERWRQFTGRKPQRQAFRAK